MVGEGISLWVGVLAALGAGFVWFAYRSRSYREEPGGELFAGLALASGLCGWFLAAGSALGVVHDVYLFGPAATAFIYLFPVLWATFAAQRAGADWLTRRRAALATAAIAVLVIDVRAAEHGLLGLTDDGVVSVGDVLFAIVPAIVAVAVSFTFMMVGVGLIVRTTLRYDHLPAGRAAALVVGAVGPWLGILVGYLLADGFPIAGLAVVSAGLASGLGGQGLALARYDLFAVSAAAGGIGRDRVVEAMDDAVIVVDDEERVLDLNPVARRLFDADPGTGVGEPLEAVVGEPFDRLRTTEVVELPTEAGRREFEPRISAVTGPEGDLLGCSLVLRDVTERRTREERLAVLNRVLRHNLRNEVSLISGYAELLSDGRAAGDEVADRITATADEMDALGEKARTIEDLMAEPAVAAEPTPVSGVLADAVASVGADHPDCEFVVDAPEELTVRANPQVLVPVVENLAENAAEHNDADRPRVEVRAAEGPDPATVTISVADNGPGLPDAERMVLETGDVTPLEHGSGLGLWVAKWGTTRLGGTLSFDTGDPQGTVATVRIPIEGPDAGVRGAPGGVEAVESG